MIGESKGTNKPCFGSEEQIGDGTPVPVAIGIKTQKQSEI
jgi:hypothetical protein